MAQEEIKEFDKLINGSKENNHILLGNGFSCAYFEEDSEKNNKMRDSNWENNIEELSLKEAIFYSLLEDKKMADDIYGQTEEQKWNFIKNIRDITEEYNPNKSATKFLSKFKNIFTLNYDLLLYRSIQKKQNIFKDWYGERIDKYYDEEGIAEIRNDESLEWNENKFNNSETETSNVFYIHGGLHLFQEQEFGGLIKDEEFKTYKLKSHDNKSLRDIIRENVNNKKSPLIIAAGTYSEKINQIQKNSYLRFCCKQLHDITGNLFIHGHSLSDVDKHIFEIINMNEKLETLNISIHKPYEENTKILNKEAEEIIEKAKDYFKNRLKDKTLKLNFYNASSVKVWQTL